MSVPRAAKAPIALVWHLATAVGLGAWAILAPGVPASLANSLTALAAAGVLGVVVSALGGRGGGGLVVAWGASAAAAGMLSGGLAGPLAIWCFAPAVAAGLLHRRALLPLGAGVSVAAVGVVALGNLFAGGIPVPTFPALQAVSAVALVLGFAAGLLAFRATVARARKREERAELALDLLDRQPQRLLALDRTGGVFAAFGASPEPPSGNLVGRNLGHLVADADLPNLAQALHDAAQDGEAEVRLRARRAAGAAAEDQWLDVVLRRAGDSGLTALIRDAGTQHAREQRLEAARIAAEQRDAGKSRFLANMSHELRTPLNAIMGFSDIMRQRLFGPLGDRYAEYSEMIHESGSHLLELINDVLDMSKIEAERFELSVERMDAREAVNAVLRLMRGQADRAGVNLRGVLPPDDLTVDADRRALKQITLNLISNALKFTPRGGAVTVTLQTSGESLELIVGDTGVGISAEDLHRLGRPYEQAGDADQRAAGSGLGLSLVRAFAELHGGGMQVESTLGAGTTVTVRLPVLAEAPGRRRQA